MPTDPPAPSPDHETPKPRPPREPPSELAGFKILRLLGEGGMGVVYEAEQSQPIRRRVALKVLKADYSSHDIVARFEAERQALAVMDHSGIAKVFEAGVTEDERPYFVMELVRGADIREYCDGRQVPLPQRLALMVEVCQAVQHAHLKGVIHRDLKPSNVLVSEEDGKPQIKVIDFGLAKAVGHRLTDTTLVTQFGQAVGTPAYMSPEQAEMSGLDVDTRTDIYSLGVMLYELVVGRLPVDPSELGYPAFIARLMLRDTDAPTPSTRFSSLEQHYQSAIAKFRASDPARLKKELGGDLGAVIMKAIDKDRNQRYDTANGLAMDLRRHLADEPVVARPPHPVYRLQKFVRRNRAAVVAVAAIFVALVAGAILATVGLVRATRAESAARVAQDKAEREAATATEVSDFLIGLFEVSDPSEARGNAVTAREILDRGAERIETELSGQPRVQTRLLHTMAQVYQSLGLYPEARRLAEKSLADRRAAFPDSSILVATALNDLGTVVENQGQYDEAVGYLQEALAILDSASGVEPVRIGEVLTNLASVYVKQAKYREALPIYNRALDLKEQQLGPDDPEVATTLYNMAVLERRLKEYDSSAVLFRRALAIRERALGPDDPAVSRTLNGLANTYVAMERYDSAEALLRTAVQQKETNLGPDHPQLANSVNNLGILFAQQGKLDSARPYFERALAIRVKTLGPDHPDLAASYNNLGLLLRDLGDYPASEDAFRRSIAIAEKALGPNHPNVGETLENYARLLRMMDRAAEAQRLDRRAERIRVEAEANRE